MPYHINVKCACGSHIGSHWCNLQYRPPEPTYTKSQVMFALEWAMDLIPDYVWNRIEEGLDKVK
jgi:hypothetical protein